MAVVVRLTNKSQITRPEATIDNEASIGFDTSLLMSRAIYQRLGSLELCKNIIDDYNNGKLPEEFREFVDGMNEIAQLGVVPPGVRAADEYLGDLGLTQKYPYSKDIRSLPNWLEGEAKNDYRILVDKSGPVMEYLVDPIDDTILVSYLN